MNSSVRNELAEMRALLRRLLKEQVAADRELNEQRIALGLPPKPFVSPELRAAITKLDAAEARAREEVKRALRVDEPREEEASQREETSSSRADSTAKQRHRTRGEDG